MTESPKTITGIFEAVYKALDAASAVVSAETAMGEIKVMSNEFRELRDSLRGIPLADLDALVKNVCQTYKNIESLIIIGLAFESISPGVLAKVTLRFGDNDITLAAPFDENGASALLEDLKKSIGVKSKIILPH